MSTVKHWQDPLNAVLGACIALSPWVLGVQGDQNITLNAVIVGALLMAASLGATYVPRAWEEWVELALDAWFVASPWIVGFSEIQNPTIFAVVAGLVTAALPLWVLLTDQDYRGGTPKLTVR